MSNASKTKLMTDETTLIAGLQKYAVSLTGLIVSGKPATVAQTITTLQARIGAIAAAQAAKVALADAVQQQNQQLASTDPFVDSLVTVLRGMYAGAPTTLADFGLTPKKVTTLTVAQKQAASLKRAATREARHTMGAKQKLRIQTYDQIEWPALALVAVA